MEKILETLKKKKKIIGAIFISLIFIYYLIWNISQPYGSGPDEQMKYDICKYIYSNNSLPHGGDEAIRNPEWGISYAFQPILAYMIGSVFMKIMAIFTTNEFALVVAARLVSTMSMTAFIYFVKKISDRLFTGIYKYLFVAFIAFQPLTAFLGSYINNDSIALLAVAVIIYSWILGLESNWKNKDCVFLGLGLGLCALTYYNAYGYILCSIVLCLISVISNKMTKKEIAKKILIVSSVAFLIAGWWFIRNAIIYDGDFLGIKTQTEYGDIYALEEYKPSTRLNPQKEGLSIVDMLFKRGWINTTIKSYIGVFAYMNLFMPNIIYYMVLLVWLIGIIGCAIKFKEIFKFNKDKKNIYFLRYVFVVSIIISIILSIFYSYASDYQPQGRYIMPMIIPFVYFITYGIEKVLEKIIKKEKIRNLIVIGLIILLFAISANAIFRYIIPFYH